MTQQEVIELMKSSKSEQEWNDNCEEVKSSFRGRYPGYWYEEVILSGLVNKVLGPGAGEIKFVNF